jgi:1-acyl-sn-glycerol-3-phosphate acyltransferase
MAGTPRPSVLYLVIAVLSWPVLRGLFRLRARGVEHLPAGPFVLAANHTSNFDPWPLGLPLFPRRFLRFMAKSELFWFPLSLVIRAGGGFRVRRGEGDVEAIETAVRLCREGHVVVMFPEGTRRRKGMRKRRQARWHSGAARIAIEAAVPLVPAAIGGADRLSRLGPLRVAYGAPISLDGGADEATERLRNAVESLEESLRSKELVSR